MKTTSPDRCCGREIGQYDLQTLKPLLTKVLCVFISGLVKEKFSNIDFFTVLVYHNVSAYAV